MKIRITSPTSVSDGQGNRYGSGQEADVPAELGRAWIDAGYAEAATTGTGPSGSGAGKPGKQAADGRRQATRRAPRATAKKAAGVPETEAADVNPDRPNHDSGSGSSGDS